MMPIASAPRQREAAPVSEDAADISEDVPAPGAEVVDGVEGFVVDDVEGFPGGSHDPLVLTEYGDHVAFSIWNGEERPELKLSSHGRKVEKFGRPAPEIEGLVTATRLTPLCWNKWPRNN
ncbi:hypothetical protein HKD37_08G023370 [Glycine soja]